MKFEDLEPPLCKPVLECIKQLQFTHMTPVQSATMPLFMTNKDVAVNATTGSGKTLAFILPIVHMLQKRLTEVKVHKDTCKVLSVVLSPTRELARQIHETAKFFFDQALPNVRVDLLVGGESVEDDTLRYNQSKGMFAIIIGTPGRIDDILTRCTLNQSIWLKDLEVLILDEADTLLDMGFQQCINQILQKLPKQRRTGLFSATQTQEVKALARAGLRNPATINVQIANTQQQTPTTLSNFYSSVKPDQKINALVAFLKAHHKEKVIVFFSTCAAVDFFHKVLSLYLTKHQLISLHGKMVQKKRTKHYEEFSNQEAGVLFCTDIVARGIDLPDLDWIVQYDPPQDPSFFVHRVGRTARAGRSGSALTFIGPTEDTYINFLSIRKIPIEAYEIPGVEDVMQPIKDIILTDRDLLEKGTKAFIAFLRSYKEHQCQFIFRFKDLDLGAVATGFGLFQLPKINEFRMGSITTFTPSTIDLATVKYKDKAREKQRQLKYKKLVEERELRKQKFKEEKTARKQEAENVQVKAPRRREKKRGRQQQIVDEWNELAQEEMLFKKLKKGKITKEQFDKAMEKNDMDFEALEQDSDGSEDDAPRKKKKSKMAQRFEKKEKRVHKTAEQKAQAKLREKKIRMKKLGQRKKARV